MITNLDPKTKKRLKSAFRDRNLTLYLGAGVSVASGLPTWDKLVLSVYFATISEEKLGNWRPFPNYLYAISEWYLREMREPLEVTARKLRKMYADGAAGEQEFLAAVRDGLYRLEDSTLHDSGRPEILANNTLLAVAKFCEAKRGKHYGVRSVITYNYDDLLETSLKHRDKRRAQPVYSDERPDTGALPIFHVHGYIPFPDDDVPEPSGVVFTEEEYNSAASNPYSWSNLVQLREMSNAIGVMVGLSLSDRNIRRLLDALALSPVRAEIFALLQKPAKIDPAKAEIDKIDDAAKDLLQRFQDSGLKSRAMNVKSAGYMRGGAKAKSKYAREIRGILSAVEDNAQEQETQVLKQLGITPIWYETHDEIGAILSEISNAN